MTTHPFVRYGEAVVRVKADLKLDQPVTNEVIAQQLEEEQYAFRVRPVRGNIEGSDTVEYQFDAIEKGKPNDGIFLSPNVLASDKAAGNVWLTTKELIGKLRSTSNNPTEDARMSYMPISGEFLNFGTSGSIGRGKSKMTLKEAGFAAIATLTRLKPSLQYRTVNESPINTALLPDLEPQLLMDFVELFGQLRASVNETSLKGRRIEEIKGGKVSVKLNRPMVFRGNFPEAPQSSSMCTLGLLAGMGEFIRRMNEDERVRYIPLMEALKSAPVYIIQYGAANVTRFNHHVVEMAKLGQLRSVIDCVYYSRLFKEGARTYGSYEYQKFDFFYSRFLQLFTPAAFQDFMAFRAEYPIQITPLFYTYFTQNQKKMNNQQTAISPEIVASAREAGSWINKAAYQRAKKELEDAKENYTYEKLQEAKAKYLVGIESMVYAAKEGHNIIGQLATVIGRMSNMDFPAEVELFFTKVATGEVSVDQAKNLLMAFSRIRSVAVKGIKEDAPDAVLEDTDEF